MAPAATEAPAAAGMVERHPSAIAAVTLRRGGVVADWRDPSLDGDARVTAWDAQALVGHDYADLLFSELAALT
jgi:hypothetical protein